MLFVPKSKEWGCFGLQIDQAWILIWGIYFCSVGLRWRVITWVTWTWRMPGNWIAFAQDRSRTEASLVSWSSWISSNLSGKKGFTSKCTWKGSNKVGQSYWDLPRVSWNHYVYLLMFSILVFVLYSAYFHQFRDLERWNEKSYQISFSVRPKKWKREENAKRLFSAF